VGVILKFNLIIPDLLGVQPAYMEWNLRLTTGAFAITTYAAAGTNDSVVTWDPVTKGY